MNVTRPPEVAIEPMYPFRYSRSRHSTSRVTCPFNNSGMLAMSEIIRNHIARRFEVEDLASDYLHQCLVSIYAFTRAVEFEIIVIDNSSPLADATFLGKEFEEIKTIPESGESWICWWK